ncbi:MAG: flavin reductase family protein [Gemmataceae bacterium]|nr:flavin reductase family protein [Gemmataceae bacterium]MCS7271683.1 flavin reductase family protein [Gemmataceae bacterium]MDW8243304.1 flavin reductase family protein [Thermogemmata sp.]
MSGETPPYAAALGRIPSGLFVLTACQQPHEAGLLVSWVQQCSFVPPRLTVAVRQGRWLLEWLQPGRPFVLNVLGEGSRELVAHFGKGWEPGTDPFQGVAVQRHGHPAPVLCQAHAYLVCQTVAHFPAGDHVLVLAEVTGGAVLHDGRPTVHIRKSGLHY